MLNHDHVDHFVVENLKKDVVRKTMKVDPSQARCVKRKRCTPFYNNIETSTKLCVELNRQVRSNFTRIVLDMTHEVIIDLRMNYDFHPILSLIRRSRSSIEIPSSGFAFNSSLRLSASATPSSESSQPAEGIERIIFPINAARSFSDKLNINFSASAIVAILSP